MADQVLSNSHRSSSSEIKCQGHAYSFLRLQVCCLRYLSTRWEYKPLSLPLNPDVFARACEEEETWAVAKWGVGAALKQFTCSFCFAHSRLMHKKRNGRHSSSPVLIRPSPLQTLSCFRNSRDPWNGEDGTQLTQLKKNRPRSSTAFQKMSSQNPSILGNGGEKNLASQGDNLQ